MAGAIWSPTTSPPSSSARYLQHRSSCTGARDVWSVCLQDQLSLAPRSSQHGSERALSRSQRSPAHPKLPRRGGRAHLQTEMKPPPKDPFYLCVYIYMGWDPLQEVMLPKSLLPNTGAVSRSLLPGCNHALLRHGVWGAGAVTAGKWGPEPRRSPQGPWPSPEMFVPLVPIHQGAQYALQWGQGGTRGLPLWCKGHKLPTASPADPQNTASTYLGQTASWC